LNLNKNKIIENISFSGSGCSIAIASASILTEIVKLKKEKEIKNIISFFLNTPKDKIYFSKNLGLNKKEKLAIKTLNSIKKYPLRIKCINLAWDVLKLILDKK
jgi:nitrogen fixation NifU-like protein